MAELPAAPGVHRPRNVDWKRAAALLYGDWGMSKAYVIGLAFIAAGYASFPIILAVCVLPSVFAYNYTIFARTSRMAVAFIPRRDGRVVFWRQREPSCWW